MIPVNGSFLCSSTLPVGTRAHADLVFKRQGRHGFHGQQLCHSLVQSNPANGEAVVKSNVAAENDELPAKINGG